METQTQNPYMVPAAIVVAGLIIAGAVVYNGGLSGSGGTANNNAPTGSGVVTPAQAADAVGLNKGDFKKCMDEGGGTQRVNANISEATASGIGGTPTSVLVTASGEQYFMEGALPADILAAYIDAAIAGDDATLTELETQYGIPEAPDVPVVSQGDHIRGSVDAPVALIEYSDLECPFCQRFHPVVGQVMTEYGDQLVWIYRHFPLESIHPSARPLAEGSECATQLGGNEKFWEFVDYVFKG